MHQQCHRAVRRDRLRHHRHGIRLVRHLDVRLGRFRLGHRGHDRGLHRRQLP